MTLIPGVSMGTKTIDCCRCLGACGSVFPINTQSLQRGSRMPARKKRGGACQWVPDYRASDCMQPWPANSKAMTLPEPQDQRCACGLQARQNLLQRDRDLLHCKGSVLTFTCEFLFVCVCSAHRSQKKVSDHLELESQRVGAVMWVVTGPLQEHPGPLTVETPVQHHEKKSFKTLMLDLKTRNEM